MDTILAVVDTVLAVVFSVSLLALLPAFILAIYSERKVSARLKEAHGRIWTEIAPLPFAQSSVSSPFAKFILERRYLQLGDAELSRFGEVARTQLRIAIWVLLATILSGVCRTLLEELA
ncbi:hypothetical protein [Lysobacter xanthus]